jgi:hypothetical protein
MNEQKVDINGELYSVEIEDDEIQNIEVAESYWNTASGELQKSLDNIGTSGAFCAHIPEENLQDALHMIGEKMTTTDIKISRIEESTLSEGGTFIQWEQPSARGLHNTPKDDKPKDLYTPEGEPARRGF